MKFIYLHVAVIFLLSGCTTWKKETLAYMGGALVTGTITGMAQAPEGDNEAMHGLLWGAVAAAATGGVLVYLRDEDEEIRQKNLKIKYLQEQLSKNTIMIDSGESQFFNKELPLSLQGLIQPGSWQLFETDEWKQVKKGKFVHQDRVLKVKPAKLRVKK